MKHLLPLLLAGLALSLHAQTPSPGGEPSERVRIAAASPHALADTLDDLGYDVLHGHGPDWIDVVVSPAEAARLRAAGLTLVTVETAVPLSLKLPPPEGVPSGYASLQDVTAALQAAEANHPGLAQVVDVAATYGPGTTFGGRPILALKISDNVTADEDEPNVLVVGLHHAREIVTPEVCLYAIDQILTSYGTDPQITAAVDGNEIWIAPVWNPDGLEYVWNVNALWRKNRKDNGDGTFGVDLNRNYPLGWDAPCGGSTNTGSNVYRGPSAASEEETQTMLAFARDRRFAKVVDFHSSGQEVLLSYDCSPMPALIETFIDDEGQNFLAPLAGYGSRDPSADGEHQEWEIQEITSYAYLVETATSFQPDHSVALAEAATVFPLIMGLIGRDIPLAGHVTEATTGLPLVAGVSVAGLAWQMGETRTSEARFGRYHLFLPPGTHDVTYAAPGFLPQTVTVTLGAAGTVVQDVALQPAPPAFTLDLSTSGGGTLDLHLQLDNVPAGTTEGFCIFSLSTPDPVGQGPLAGLYPDVASLLILQTPAQAGDVLHWTWPVSPPLFPAQPFDVGPGGLPLPPGTDLDGVAVAFGPGYVSAVLTSVTRITL